MSDVRKQQGFLMVEVAIAVVIISVALVAIVNMFTQSTTSTINSGNYTTAVNLAQKRLERLKTEDSAFWQDVCNKGTIEGEADHSTINNIDYDITTNVVEFPVKGKDVIVTLAQVTVLVEWDTQSENGNMDRSHVQLTSLYDKNP